jgi:hypothetical protein
MVTPIVQANKLNLLGLINAATAELGLQQYTQIVGNTDTQAMQLLALAKREGKEFYQLGIRKEGWEELRAEYTFSLTAPNTSFTGTTINNNNQVVVPSGFFSTVSLGPPTPLVTGDGIPTGTYINFVSSGINSIFLTKTATASASGVALTFSYDRYALPNDFAYLITQTGWDRSFRWQMLGPLSAQEWQVLKSGISPTGPRRRYRIMGNYIFIDPVPTSVEDIVFEYYSNAWCQSVDAVAQSTWQADTDYYTLDDDCFILGLKWRFLAAKKLDFEQEYETYQRACERVAARNAGQRDLPLNATASGIRLLNNNNVPDTGYGA